MPFTLALWHGFIVKQNTNRPPTLIGGSGSSGSTLLAKALDRHPKIVCTPEMSFFNKHVVYGDFRKFKRNFPRWISKGVPTNGYFAYTSMFPWRSASCISDTDLTDWARRSRNIRDFVEQMQTHLFRNNDKSIFVEKTPSNCYCFSDFLEAFPTGRVIHIVRDGRDVVSSLIDRGYDVFKATSMWLYNTAAGLACHDSSRYLMVHYEDLVRQPEVEIKKVCEHLSVEYSSKMLVVDGSDMDASRMVSTWRNSPTKDPINPSSVGRYKVDLNALKLAKFSNIRLTKIGAEKTIGKVLGTGELLRHLGYTEANFDGLKYPSCDRLDPLIDLVRRNIPLLTWYGRFARPLTWTSGRIRGFGR